MLKEQWDEFCVNAIFVKNLGLSCAAYLEVIIREIELQIEETLDTVVEKIQIKLRESGVDLGATRGKIEHEVGETSITMDEFRGLLGISNSMQTKHRRKLEYLGLIKAVRKGLPAKLHFIIDYRCYCNISDIIRFGSL